MITATKPFSPPLDLYQNKVAEIFENKWFTNHGPMVTELENKLKTYFNVPYLVLVSNGTIALQIAIKAEIVVVNILDKRCLIDAYSQQTLARIVWGSGHDINKNNIVRS